VFDAYLLLRRRKSLWLLRQSPHLEVGCHYKVSTAGMRAFRVIDDFIKPSTRMIQIFGHLATRCKVNLDNGQLANLLENGALEIDLGVTNGYVVLCFRGRVLGMGLLLRGELRSQLPRKDLPCLRNALTGEPGP